MTTTSDRDAERYLEALKELLKERSVTYGDLAGALGRSLPTIKRALNKPSTSLSRLIEMCEAAHIDFSDLHERAERRRPRHYEFSEEQDRLFFERPETLRYFVELATEDASPASLASDHDLDDESTRLYLSHLAAVGLIEISEDETMVLAHPPFGFVPGSRVLRRDQAEFMQRMVATVLDGDPGETGAIAVLKAFRLSESDYHRMVREIVHVIDRFAAISERAPAREDAALWQTAVACGPYPDSETCPIPRIDA